MKKGDDDDDNNNQKRKKKLRKNIAKLTKLSCVMVICNQSLITYGGSVVDRKSLQPITYEFKIINLSNGKLYYYASNHIFISKI